MDTLTPSDLNKLLTLAGYGAEMAANSADMKDAVTAEKHKKNADLLQRANAWLTGLMDSTPEDGFKQAAETLRNISLLQKMRAETILTLDVAHVTEETVGLLNGKDTFGLEIYDMGEDGWFISTKVSNVYDPSPSLDDVLHYATECGFAWVILKVGGPVITSIPHYGWSAV